MYKRFFAFGCSYVNLGFNPQSEFLHLDENAHHRYANSLLIPELKNRNWLTDNNQSL